MQAPSQRTRLTLCPLPLHFWGPGSERRWGELGKRLWLRHMVSGPQTPGFNTLREQICTLLSADERTKVQGGEEVYPRSRRLGKGRAQNQASCLPAWS